VRIAHPRKDYHDPSLSEAERRYRIRRYRAALDSWFRDMDDKRGRTTPRSKREDRFCIAIAIGAGHLMNHGAKVTKKQMRTLGVAALDDAGYRNPNEAKSAELFELPRVQSRIMQILADLGIDVALAGEVLGRCMRDTEDNVTALNAAELYFKVVTGFAVQKSANLHKHERADRFFDDTAFSNPGKPLIATSQES
jgi:hypothetical protein